MRWYRVAAEGGNDVAATALGLLRVSGTEPDPGEARRRLSGTDARGFAHAQYGMGLLALAVGDKARATFWLAKASAQSHAGARAALAGLDTASRAAA